MNRLNAFALTLASAAIVLGSGGAAEAAVKSAKPKIWVAATMEASTYWPCKGGFIEVDVEAGSRSTDWIVIKITDKTGKRISGSSETFEMPEVKSGYVHHKECTSKALVEAVAHGSRYYVNAYAYQGNKLLAKSTARLVPYRP